MATKTKYLDRYYLTAAGRIMNDLVDAHDALDDAYDAAHPNEAHGRYISPCGML